jgi:hypothetical protein
METTMSDTAPARSWLAIKGKSPEAVHGELRLRPSTLSGDDALTFQIVGANSDAGWYLIVARGRDHRLIQDAAVQPLSNGCEVVTCTVQEAEIYSAAAGWRNGRREWSLSYDGANDGAEVVAVGELPFVYPAIRDRFIAEAQAEDAGDALVDPVFEIAVETVHNLIGYKPYDKSAAFNGRFVILEGIDTPWLKRLLFGG